MPWNFRFPEDRRSKMFPFPYHQNPPIPQFDIAVFKTIDVGTSLPVCESVGMVTEEKAQTHQFILWNLHFFHAIGNNTLQNVSIYL